MNMKPLVKTVHGYLAENLSPEEERELDSLSTAIADTIFEKLT
jgi:hypothetical protein